jgi:iron complex transport system ATP-binding protein
MVNAAELRLQARGLAFAYPGGAPVLHGIDFDLAAGSLVAILGPNGAGKSTLLRVACGLLVPQQGRVEVDAVPLERLAHRERARRIALVPQALRSLPAVDVATFVLGGRYAHRSGWWGASAADRTAVERALVDCDLADLGDRPLDELSGGQRQRALLARALAQEVAVLLVDEPTNSLDPEHQLGVFDLLARLSCGGRAIAVVTHDLNLSSQYATEVALLAAGRLVARGAPREILRPATLAPVYGTRLAYGVFDAPAGQAARPWILPERGVAGASAASAQGPR